MSVTTSPSPADAAPGRPRLRRSRALLLTGGYALLSLWALVMSGFGPVAALTAQLPDPSLRFAAVAAGGFKVLTLGAAAAVLLSRGRSVFAVRVLLAGQVVWLATDLLAPQGQEGMSAALVRFVVSTAIWVGPWLLLAPGRRRLWSEPLTVRRLPAVVTVVAAAPLVAWATTTAGLDVSGTLPGEGTYAELRYDLTGLSLAVLAALVLASVDARRPWWDRLVAVVCIVVGGLAAVYPDGYASPGPAGLGLLAVAAALLASPAIERRRATEGATSR